VPYNFLPYTDRYLPYLCHSFYTAQHSHNRNQQQDSTTLLQQRTLTGGFDNKRISRIHCPQNTNTSLKYHRNQFNMNPHQKNKVDINSLSPDEQRLFRLYGKVPSKTDHLAKHLKERKYFDSGDYALSKSGAASSVDTGSVGTQHPLPENIPHLSKPMSGPGTPNQGGMGNGNGPLQSKGGIPGVKAGSPVKDNSFLNRQSSVNDVDKPKEEENKNGGIGSVAA